MTDFLTVYLLAFFDLLEDLWLWMLIGFLIAALIEEFVSVKRITRYFGENNLKSLAAAALSGTFVSACSCGAMPVAATLRRRGASTATAMTFLLATPWAGFTHLFILASFIGVANMALLFFVSLAVVIGTGMLLAGMENRDLIERGFTAKHLKGERIKCLRCAELERIGHVKESLWKRLAVCVPRGMLEIVWAVGKFMFIGLLIAAFFKAFIPANAVKGYFGAGQGAFGVLLALPLSMVLELCSEGFAVFAGQLYAMGASLGVVFVMTMVGTASDFTELSMLWGVFGRRCAVAYIAVATIITALAAIALTLA